MSDLWPAHCSHPAECADRRKCLYFGCLHAEERCGRPDAPSVDWTLIGREELKGVTQSIDLRDLIAGLFYERVAPHGARAWSQIPAKYRTSFQADADRFQAALTAAGFEIVSKEPVQ